MSWDAVILKIQGPFRPIEEVADEDYLPLGSIESVAERIRSAFPGAQWSNPTWATWSLDGDTGVTIDLEGVESSNSILVSVSGSGNPVPHLLAVARANDWVVLDASTTEFINPDEGASEGWEGYQSVRDRLPLPIPDSGDQTLPETPPEPSPQTPPQTPPPAAPETPPRAPKKKTAVKPKKKKAARKVKRTVKRQKAAKQAKRRKTNRKKKKVAKQRPKKKVPGKKAARKKGARKKTAKKKK